jgi:hypothetical protein
MYSLNQITYGALLGGPAAATYFLRENFRRMGNAAEQKKMTVLGVGATIMFPLISLIIPNVPGAIIAFVILLLATVAYRIGKYRQNAFVLEQVSRGQTLASNFRVGYVVILALLAQASVSVVWLLVFTLAGYEFT